MKPRFRARLPSHHDHPPSQTQRKLLATNHQDCLLFRLKELAQPAHELCTDLVQYLAAPRYPEAFCYKEANSSGNDETFRQLASARGQQRNLWHHRNP